MRVPRNMWCGGRRGGGANQRSFAPAVLPALLLAAGACQPSGTHIRIQSFERPEAPQHRYTDFTDAYFAETKPRCPDIVLFWRQPSSVDPSVTITQVVHVKICWTPIPGVTAVERSMVNATIHYMILTPPTGISYDGAGFVSFKLDRKKGTLTGRIESGDLYPKRRVGGAIEPFGPARIEGRFSAVRDRLRVAKILRQANQLLGPVP